MAQEFRAGSDPNESLRKPERTPHGKIQPPYHRFYLPGRLRDEDEARIGAESLGRKFLQVLGPSPNPQSGTRSHSCDHSLPDTPFLSLPHPTVFAFPFSHKVGVPQLLIPPPLGIKSCSLQPLTSGLGGPRDPQHVSGEGQLKQEEPSWIWGRREGRAGRGMGSGKGEAGEMAQDSRIPANPLHLPPLR